MPVDIPATLPTQTAPRSLTTAVPSAVLFEESEARGRDTMRTTDRVDADGRSATSPASRCSAPGANLAHALPPGTGPRVARQTESYAHVTASTRVGLARRARSAGA